MSTTNKDAHSLVTRTLAVIAVFLSLMVGYGCQEESPSATTKPGALSSAAPAEKGGAELWAENCMRCHNLRPPTQFSNNEWQIIMHHMRIRADLTGKQQQAILQFIQSANMN